jgi:polysaccharide export outer membrane protein
MKASPRGPSLIAAALGCFLAAAPLLAQGTQQAPPQDDASHQAAPASADYVIGVEDALSIAVWKEPDLTKLVSVRPDGKISFPLIGDLQASGKTPRQLSATLTEALAKFIKEPIVTVTVEQINNFKIYMIGEIGAQGELTLKRRTRLLQAIAMAGGLSPYASKNIVVVRDEGGREVRTEIDYRKVISGERPELNIYLKPGDTIIVP